jgi:hypothetical protein
MLMCFFKLGGMAFGEKSSDMFLREKKLLSKDEDWHVWGGRVSGSRQDEL